MHSLMIIQLFISDSAEIARLSPTKYFATLSDTITKIAAIFGMKNCSAIFHIIPKQNLSGLEGI